MSWSKKNFDLFRWQRTECVLAIKEGHTFAVLINRHMNILPKEGNCFEINCYLVYLHPTRNQFSQKSTQQVIKLMSLFNLRMQRDCFLLTSLIVDLGVVLEVLSRS